MNDLPRGERLLMLARDLLLRDLVPLLPEERQLDGRMIANAMAIAARELELRSEEGTALAEAQQMLNAKVTSLGSQQRLSAEIKDGRHDGDEAIHQLLTRMARARLSIANPKALRIDDST